MLIVDESWGQYFCDIFQKKIFQNEISPALVS